MLTKHLFFSRLLSFRRKRIRSIACGSAHSMLLSGSGTVYSFGVGIEGQLGHDTEITRLTLPQAISENAFDGAVAQISAGENFSVAITRNNNNNNISTSDERLNRRRVFQLTAICTCGARTPIESCSVIDLKATDSGRHFALTQTVAKSRRLVVSPLQNKISRRVFADKMRIMAHFSHNGAAR